MPGCRLAAHGLIAAVILGAGLTVVAEDVPLKVDVFTGGVDGYHTYRIPALVISSRGTVLAFCEARKNSASDQGDIDLVLKRSTDGGMTWGAMQRVHEEGGDAPVTIGNPCPIVAHDRDRVHLLFTRDNKRLLVTHSGDDGLSWAAPQEITEILKEVDFPWLRVASGPVHGIQLHNGLLVVPLWYCDSEAIAAEKRYRAGVVFGDGEFWKAGGLVPESIPRLNECTVLERRDRSLLLNMRAYKAGYRAVSESRDGGQSWTAPMLDTDLPDPTCQGSLLRLSSGDVAFANIPAETRTDLTVRLSRDDGASWAHARLLEAGPSAYSDLAQRADGTILCLYERGTARYNERISAALFRQDWIVALDTESTEP